jgi:hypothetical protein
MINGDALVSINQAVCYELQAITKRYGAAYASPHEGYAVLKEEYEEAQECLELLNSKLDEIWKNVKMNWNDSTVIYQAQQSAIALAEEAVQCAAVCERYIATVDALLGQK